MQKKKKKQCCQKWNHCINFFLTNSLSKHGILSSHYSINLSLARCLSFSPTLNLCRILVVYQNLCLDSVTERAKVHLVYPTAPAPSIHSLYSRPFLNQANIIYFSLHKRAKKTMLHKYAKKIGSKMGYTCINIWLNYLKNKNSKLPIMLSSQSAFFYL